jgi:hypothetical protein
MTSMNLRGPRALAPLLLALSLLPAPARAAFERVGPVNPANGYPAWYQDKTGLTLEFCSPTTQYELDNGYCLILPGPPPAILTAPELFPTNFSDEHFYYSADALGDMVLNGANGGKARLVQALEGAFATGPVIAGEQVVFGRLRFDFRDLPFDGTYIVYTPYGVRTFPNQVGGPKTRLFYTEDIGITCPVGDFTCALQATVGPFLLPSVAVGGLELPPFADPNLPNRLYIADPARLGPVTGSIQGTYQTATGPADPNRFRIDVDRGPANGGVVTVLDVVDFALMGRIYQQPIPSRVKIDRASYARSVAGNVSVDVYATGEPTLAPRLPAAPASVSTFPQLAFFEAPCGGTPDPLNPGGVLPPYTAPAGASIAMPHFGTVYYGHSAPAAIPAGVCVVNLNATDAAGNLVPHYDPAPLGDQIFISEAYYDPANSTLNVFATSSDDFAPPELSVGAFGDLPANQVMTAGAIAIGPIAAPPATVRVLSQEGGSNTMQVKVGRKAASSVTLVASKASPQVQGTAVTFTATAAGSTGYSYRFLLSADGGTTFTEVLPYGTANTWTMLGTQAAGAYVVRVEVRTTAGVAFDVATTLAFTLRLPPPATLTLATDLASPQNIGTAVTLTATATGSSGYQFKFSRSTDNGVTYTLVRDWAAGNTLAVDTTAAGSFRYLVEVRTFAGVARDLSATLGFVVRNPPATLVTLTASPSTTLAQGAVGSLTATGTATVPGTPIYYRFWRSTDGGLTYTVIQNSALNATIPIDTTVAGSFRYMVDASTNPTINAREVLATLTVTVQAPQPPAATGITVTASPASPQKVGTAVVITGTGTSTTPGLTFEYRFWLSVDNGVTYQLQQNYSTTNTWTLPTATAGTYRVMVDVRTVGRTASRDALSIIAYTVQP